MLSSLLVIGVLTLQSPAPRTALTPDLPRAQQHDRAGWVRVDAADFDGAAREFEAALQIYPEYADALHGLGKARMALKEYGAAARVLERCRDSYAHAGTQDAEHRLLANRARENQLATLRRRLAELEGASAAAAGRGGAPPGTEILDVKQEVRELQAQRD